APTAGFRRGILERKNQRVVLKNAAHDISLDADAAAVNDSNFSKSGLPTLLKIFFDDARNIFRGEGMEIDEIFDRKNNRFGKRRFAIRIRSFYIFTAPPHRKKGKKLSLLSLVLNSSQLLVLSPSACRRLNALPLCQERPGSQRDRLTSHSLASLPP